MAYVGNQPYQVAFVTDTFSGNGSTVAFTMSVAPANTASVLVVVSGVVQDPSTYSVSGTTLTFTAAPPSATGNISVRYLGIPASGVTTTAYRTVTEFTATAGQTTFTPPSYTVGFINVYRNGALLGSADYTASNGTTVVLANAATSGDLVTVESFLVSSVLNAIPATAGSVGTTYLAGSSVTTAKLASGAVTQSILGTNVAGTGPAFSVYMSSNASPSTTTWTKVAFNTKIFDTNTNFDATTNYRFTPTIAGYYQINALMNTAQAATSSTRNALAIYKNGSQYRLQYTYAVSGDYGILSVYDVISMNGSTDYLEVYMYCTLSSTFYGGSTGAVFSGALVRSA